MPRLPARLRHWWPQAKSAYTVATRAVAPATQILARVSDHGAPRGIALTAEDAAAGSAGAHVWLVRGPEEIVRPLPIGVPPGHRNFREAQAAHVPRAVVAELPGARVDGRTGAVITDQHKLVEEFSSYFGTARPTEHPLFLRPFRRAPLHVEGVVAVLASRGDGNYYHFLFDVLPRLGVLAQCADAPLPDVFYVPRSTGFQRELLDRLGITADRCVDSREHPYVWARRMLVPSLPDRDLQTPGWVVRWLRDQVGPRSSSGPRRKLYVTRGSGVGVRALVNEAELLSELIPRGFERVDPGAMTVAEQIAAFSAADVVVAPHGAALANLVFIDPGTKVLEIFAPDYVNTCYWGLVNQLQDVDYRYLLGRGEEPTGRLHGIASEIDVDVSALLKLLDR